MANEPRRLSLPAAPTRGGSADAGAASGVRRSSLPATLTSSVRNKVKYLESVQRIQEIQRRLEQTPKHTTSDRAAHAELLEQTREICQILSSSVQATNAQNEDTIRHLQGQLVKVTRERDAAVKDAERVKKIAAKRCAEWEDKLQHERKGFAAAMHKRKKEALELKRRVNKYGKRCRQLECELKERGGATESGEGGRARGKARSTATDTGVPNMVVIHDEVRARAKKLPNWAEASDGTMGSGEQRTATTAADSSNDSAHGDFRERAAQFAHSIDAKLKDWKRMRPSQTHRVAAMGSPSDEKDLAEKKGALERTDCIETDQESTSGGEERNKLSPPPFQTDPEIHALRSSMEEFAQLANDMNERMKSFARHHEASVKNYEEKLETVNGELNQSFMTLDSLKEQYEVLGNALKESNDTEEYYERVFMDVIQEKDDAVKKATLERDEAYDACGTLQAEIDLLRKMPQSTSLKETSL